MKKNKFTSLVTMITSIAFVGSMVALPAYAAESTIATVSEADTNITNEKTTTEKNIVENEVDLWGEKVEGGIYKIGVDSKTYPIERLSISIGGGAEQVIPTKAGFSYAEFIQRVPSNQIATIKAKLADGSIVIGTFNPLKPLDPTATNFVGSTYHDSANRPAKAAVKTLAPKASSIQALNTPATPIGGAAFKTAAAGGFTLDGTTVANPTVQYMGRLTSTPAAAYKLYPNSTALFTAARTRAYEVILVVTIPGQGTFYVSGAASSNTAPSNTATGYVIKGA